MTPSFNQAAFLEATVRSILLQDYPRLEYIVIDGGSTDGSVDILQKYSDYVSYWVSEPDRGQSQAINKGFERATGDILAWVNSDDYYLPGALWKVAALFANRPDVGVVYGDCLFLDSAGVTTLQPSEPIDLRRMLVGKNPVWQPSTFFRRDAIEKIGGGVDETFNLALDYELWLRLLKSTDFLRVEDGPLSVVHDYAETKSRSQWSAFMEEILRAVERFYSTPGVPRSAIPLKRSVYATLYFECASAALLGKGSVGSAIVWLLRAIQVDPRILLRLPWVGRQLVERQISNSQQ